MTEKKKNLQDWAALAEVISSIAVVITLALLFFEVRNNTSVIEREALRERTTTSREFFVSNPQLSVILGKIKEIDTENIGACGEAFISTYNLSFEEADTWCRYLGIAWFDRQAEYLYGTEEFRRIMREVAFPAILSSPDQALYWETAKMGNNALQQEFIEAVNNSLRED